MKPDPDHSELLTHGRIGGTVVMPEHVSSVTLDRSGQTGVTSAGEQMSLPADGVLTSHR